MKDKEDKTPSKRFYIGMSEEYQAMALIDKAMELCKYPYLKQRVLYHAIAKHMDGGKINKFVYVKTGSVSE